MANVNREAERQQQDQNQRRDSNSGGAGAGAGGSLFRFQMPLHYPRYTEADYEKMPEWQLDRLLSQYGLPLYGSLHDKRSFAIGTFLWPPTN